MIRQSPRTRTWRRKMQSEQQTNKHAKCDNATTNTRMNKKDNGTPSRTTRKTPVRKLYWNMMRIDNLAMLNLHKLEAEYR